MTIRDTHKFMFENLKLRSTPTGGYCYEFEGPVPAGITAKLGGRTRGLSWSDIREAFPDYRGNPDSRITG